MGKILVFVFLLRLKSSLNLFIIIIIIILPPCRIIKQKGTTASGACKWRKACTQYREKKKGAIEFCELICKYFFPSIAYSALASKLASSLKDFLVREFSKSVTGIEQRE